MVSTSANSQVPASLAGDVVLIHPSGSNWITGKKDMATVFNRIPPLGLIALAAYLEKEGVPVRILDLMGASPEKSEMERIDELIGRRPAYYGFTTTTSSFPDAYEKAEYIKRRDPEGKIVFGGAHVSALGPKSLQPYPAIDYAVAGEGEFPMTALSKGGDPSTIPGLAYRVSGEMRYNGRATQMAQMDDLPIPAYHLLDDFPHSYRLPMFNAPTANGAPIISSRGCPYSCSYCDRSVFGASYRHNSPAYLVAHMKTLYDRYGITHFNLYDDLFTLKRKRVEEVCGLLADMGRPFTFNCSVRIGHVNLELVEILKSGGCWMISLGVESGDEELIGQHKEGVKLDEVRQVVAMIRNTGIRVKGLFILGLPGETPQTAASTKRFINETGFDDINLTKFAPFPGSPAYATIGEHGEFTGDWSQLNCMNFVFRPHGFASLAELDKTYNDIVRSFYSSKPWVKRFVYELFRYPHNLAFVGRNLLNILKAGKSFS